MTNPETAVIGCLVISNHQHELFSMLSAEDFQDIQNADAYTALREIWTRRGKIDEVLISGLSEETKTTVVTALDASFVPSNWKQYAELTKQNNIVARAGIIGMQLAGVDADIELVQQKADELIKIIYETTDAESLDMVNGLAQFMTEKQKPRTYIKTGYKKIDRHTHIDKGDYIVVGGRPSAGKTAFTLSLALNIANTGCRVVYFSLETSTQKIMDRIMTAYCGLDFDKVKEQQLTSDDWTTVARKSDGLAKLPIEIVKASGKTVPWIRGESIRRKADVVFIDYIGLVASEGNSRYEKMTQTSLDIHNFAQQTGTTVFALSQLNRGGADREPRMEDLRESGQIEQDADVILLLHMPEQKNSGDVFRDFRVNISKNKEGAVGQVMMDFDGAHQQFFELEQRYE